ncbi:MAG: nitroreductase family protein [Acidimicrobiales bacterium]
METLSAIARRRSVARLRPPGPTDADLHRILAAAASAPDHEELRPWRFVVLAGDAKDAFGEVLADAYLARRRASGAEPTEGQVEKERGKLGRAPVVVVVAAACREHPTVPPVEQLASAAAAAQNALLAATDLGYGSMWRTGDAAYDPSVKDALGLSAGDAILGFLYIGTRPDGLSPEEHNPRMEGLVRVWAPGPRR